MRKRLMRLAGTGLSAVMAGSLFVGGVAADPGGLPDIEGVGLVEIVVPDRDAIDALNNGDWDLAEYVRQNDDGSFTLNVNATSEEIATLAAMGVGIGDVIEDEGTWRERLAERDAALAARATAADLAESGTAAAPFQLFSSFLLPQQAIVIQRADYFENYAGRFISVEAHATGSTTSTGPSMAMSFDAGPGTDFGSSTNMSKFNDAGQYLYHRTLVRVGAAGSTSPAAPSTVRVASSLGDVAEVPVREWLPGEFPDNPLLPHFVTVDGGSAAGDYGANGASFGPPPPVGGVPGSIVLVDDGTAAPTEGCSALIGFPAGAIALVDRGNCPFVQKVANAQAAGAVAVIVANNVGGDPTNMGGTDPSLTIPAVMISIDAGATIKAGLPATGSVAAFEFTPDYPVGFQSHFFDSYMDPTQVHAQLGDLVDEFPGLIEAIDLPNLTDGYQRPGMAIMKNGTSNPGSAPSGGTAQSQAVVLWSHAMGHEGGNAIQAAFVDPGVASSPLSVAVSPNGLGGSDIVVNLATDAGGALASTAAEVVAAINAAPAASALVRATTWATNAGGGIAQARDLVALSDFLSAPEHVQRGPFQNKVYRIGSTRDGSKVGVFLYCQQHAREWVTPLTCLETAERLVRNYSFDPLTTQLVDNLEVFILPTSNPDGAHYSLYDFNSQRKNLKNYCEILNPTATNAMPSGRNGWGVDNNRNNTVGTLFDGYDGASTSCSSEVYAGPFEASEPEIQNEIWVADTFDNIKFANNIHTYGGYFMWAPGSYIANGRITLPAPNIGIESYFFQAGDTVLQRIKEYRGVVVLPQRTGPIADVLYSAAGNSADEQYYNHDIIAYSFEAGADRFTSGSSGTSQSAVGFQPNFASEGQHEAMEFANGNYGLLESAVEYAMDTTAPTVDFLVCDSLSPTIECDPVTTNQAKQTGTYVTTFAFGNEPSVVRYTTDGSTPDMSSPLWEAQGPRRPGQFFEFDTTTTIKWFGTDIKGNQGPVQTIKLSIDDVDPTIDLVEPQDAAGVGGEGFPGNYPLDSEQLASYSCDDDDSGVISCVGTVADGAAFDTSSVGFHDFTVDAEDLAGNTASVTHTYNVYFPGNGGLQPPFDGAEGSTISVGAGSALPLKFTLGGVDYGLDILAEGFPRTAEVDCDTLEILGAWEHLEAAGASGFRMTDGSYHYNAKTNPGWRGTCRVLQLKLIDNSVYEVVLDF